jgi:DNA-binding MarR family transcriptional regulator
MPQFNVLRILKGSDPEALTVNTIIDRMIDKSSNASRIVEKLRQKGLVKRKTCKEDRRRVDVVITEKGKELLEEANRELKKADLMERSITAEEADELNRILNKIRTNTKI